MENPEETKTQALVRLNNNEEKALVPQRPSLNQILRNFSPEEILGNFTTEEILRYLQNPIPPAAPVGPDRVWKLNFFLDAVKVFRKQNLPPDHIRLGLIFLVALTSAHVGNPIVLEVIDDVAAGAADLLQRCKELTGVSFWKTFNQMSVDDLAKSKDDIKGKCIAEGDSSKFEKGKEPLNQFLADRKLIDQRTVMTPVGNRSMTTEILGPTACVLITKNPKKLILTHPTFWGIHFKPPIQGFYAPELEEREKARLKVKNDVIKSYLQRLQEVQVKIPYRDAIVQHLQGSKNQYVVKKIDMLLRMLKVVTIINYSSCMTAGEIYNRFHGSDPRTVELALGLPSIPQESLIARKADYVTFWMLVDGTVKIEEVSFSERERRVFRVVKDFNEGALGTGFMPPNATKFDKLAQIPNSPSTWPDLPTIFKRVNEDGGEEIGKTPTVYSVLQELEEKGVIKNAKDPNGRQHGYYVTTWELSDTISLPDPAAIEDPFTGKEPIEVINPISGKVWVG
jgi:hypothetical protein